MYHCGFKQYNEFVCVGYIGFPGEKARRWLIDRIGSVKENPQARVEASKDFSKPSKILVDLNGKYPEIKTYEWSKK
jgi:hypothetical protein